MGNLGGTTPGAPRAAARGATAVLCVTLFAASGSALAADRRSPPPDSTGGITAKVSTEVSGYADTDHVLVASPSIAGGLSDEVAGWAVSGHYLVDVVSAASVDIVSTASSKWQEVRQAGALDASWKLGDVGLGASGVVSSEPDYLSLAGGGTLSLDILDKNVTPFLGFSYSQDQVGKTGLPHEFWRNKETIAGRVGVTFVVDRSTIASLQGDTVAETGYLAKPYRYIPLFAPSQAAVLQPGASIDQVNATRLSYRPAEQLPNARHRFAITGRIAHRFDVATLRLDERAYADTWGLLATTTEFRYMLDLGRRVTLWPHLRFHYQNGVVFWQLAYQGAGSDGSLGIPAIRTGDRELSPLYTGTGGFGVRFKLVDDVRKPWSLVFEVDGSYTRYLDALYISERRALFSTLAIEAEF
jgi:hypothetical protein